MESQPCLDITSAEKPLGICNHPLITGIPSLKFLSIKGLYNAMVHKGRDNTSPQFTDHCFTGDYPINIEEIQNLKNELFD